VAFSVATKKNTQDLNERTIGFILAARIGNVAIDIEDPSTLIRPVWIVRTPRRAVTKENILWHRYTGLDSGNNDIRGIPKVKRVR
jgi:hypothetical protein